MFRYEPVQQYADHFPFHLVSDCDISRHDRDVFLLLIALRARDSLDLPCVDVDVFCILL